MDAVFDKLPYERLSNVQFTHLLGGAVCLGLVLYLIFHLTLFGALKDDLTSLNKKKTQAENKLRTYQTTLSQKGNISEELAAGHGDLAQIKRQMPRQYEIVDFLKNVAQMGTALGLNIVLIQSLPEETNDFFRETPIEINVQGGFYKTMGFLNTVQNLLRLVNVTQVKMEIVEFQGGPTQRGGTGPMKILQTNSVAVAYSYVEGSEDKSASKKKT
ncbi:MAG: type 4a pilus biogenesis protein PilO [Nitrospinota bacterium]|nr:type 4a pilus biogenesis protein PilO [Nitrospinota bacterium]